MSRNLKALYYPLPSRGECVTRRCVYLLWSHFLDQKSPGSSPGGAISKARLPCGCRAFVVCAACRCPLGRAAATVQS